MQTFMSMVEFKNGIQDFHYNLDFDELIKKHNILQPYDILGGYSICDFYTF
jgi:hypothetical protein